MSQAMNKKLYVGSLPYSISEEELRELFAPYGEITSAKIIIDRATGQSKGFGFVEMAEEEDAQRAISEMHGKQLGGRTLIVSAARPEPTREHREHRGGRGDYSSRPMGGRRFGN